MTQLQTLIEHHVGEATRGLASLRKTSATVERWALAIVGRINDRGRVLVMGNGGSAAQAEHLAAELVGRYRDERRPLPALSLSTDAAILTALANDYDADQLFARQVTAHARQADVVLFLSTSGRSANLLAAAQAAKAVGALTLALTGPAPNPLVPMCCDALCADAASTAAVQEVHLVVLHSLCECIDQLLQVSA